MAQPTTRCRCVTSGRARGRRSLLLRSREPDQDLLVRSWQPDLEVRSTAKGRSIVGIAVPWDVEEEIDPYLVEGFRAGAFDHQFGAFHRIKLSREHITLGGQLIGRGMEARNDAAGLWVQMLVARTPLGDETLALVEDGALSHLSVGYLARQSRPAPSTRYRGRDTQWRLRGDLVEVAVVLEGAYGDLASATGVRARDTRPGIHEAQRVLDSLPLLPPVS